METLPTSHSLFLSQQHYVCELSISTNMQDAKLVSTSLSTSSNVSSCDIWDVSFLVNKLSHYMQAPTEIHMKSVNRLLRYLKGTLDHGLHFSQATNLSLIAFYDSDWGGDTHDRKFVAAYLIYIGPNVISWSSKKQPTIAKSSMEADY